MARCDNAVEFRPDLQILRRTDPSFVSYLTAHWLHITRKWAIHAQHGLVHFGNVTNSRPENANGRLKRRVHHSDILEQAVLKVAHRSQWLMREYEMHTTYCCDRREIREGDIYVLRVVFRMTTYAANQVLRHIGICTPNLLYKQTNRFKTVNTSAGTCTCCGNEPCPLCGENLQARPPIADQSTYRSAKRACFDVLDRSMEDKPSVPRKTVAIKLFFPISELMEADLAFESRDDEEFM